MNVPDREIPQRELRNSISSVLREVEDGASLRVTVSGKAVADLVPVRTERTFVPRSEVVRIIAESPLDERFAADVDEVLGATIEEL